MGITGLLPFMEKATRPCHVSEFRGGTVAVDAYCFLHKGVSSCAEQLARGEDNQMYVQYCLKYVKMLQSYDIHVVMVFDGRNLPAKAETEVKRRESRKKAKQRAAELLLLGKTEEARSHLKQSIDITPKMAHNVIRECRKLNVDCIVSPYESDAQMAFFSLKGVAECVITEDSDLVLFGCKQILYKLDLQGAGRLVESKNLLKTMKIRPDQFTFDKFRFMCILSGCDYVNSLSGIGLKKAEKFFQLTAETNPEIFLDRIPRYLNMKHLVVTEEYKKNVLIANATFLHQVVFDPYKKKLVHLTDPEITGTNPEYLVNAGEMFDNEKAYNVALGNLNPYNFERCDNWSPSNLPPHSIWSGIFKKRISRKQQRSNVNKLASTDIIDSRLCETQEICHKEEEDFQIQKDLLVYTKKQELNIDIETDTAAPQEVVCRSKDRSDSLLVTSKNPFQRKKISKFPKTYAYGNTIVKSRFFVSSETENAKVSGTENETQFTEVQECIVENKHCIKTNDLLDSKESSIVDTSLIEIKEETLKSCKNSNKPLVKKRCLDYVLKVANGNENEAIQVSSTQFTEENMTEHSSPVVSFLAMQCDTLQKKTEKFDKGG